MIKNRSIVVCQTEEAHNSIIKTLMVEKSRNTASIKKTCELDQYVHINDPNQGWIFNREQLVQGLRPSEPSKTPGSLCGI